MSLPTVIRVARNACDLYAPAKEVSTRRSSSVRKPLCRSSRAQHHLRLSSNSLNELSCKALPTRRGGPEKRIPRAPCPPRSSPAVWGHEVRIQWHSNDAVPTPDAVCRLVADRFVCYELVSVVRRALARLSPGRDGARFPAHSRDATQSTLLPTQSDLLCLLPVSSIGGRRRCC